MKTQYFSELISNETSKTIYEYLQNNLEWQDGIYSRKYKRMSRKAYLVKEDDIDKFIEDIVIDVLSKINNGDNQYALFGTYINYYRNGNDFLPSHSHPNTLQLVISLGSTRTLYVGKKEYKMKSGDVILFGSSSHNIPMEPEITEGRISIATFIKKL